MSEQIRAVQHLLGRFKRAQEYGLRETICKVWGRLFSYMRLQVRTFRWTFTSGKLPSDQEILGLIEEEWNSLDKLIAHLCSKGCPAVLFSARDKEEYIEILRDRYTLNVEETIKRAEDIRKHRFQFLGRDLQFTDDIDWHFDPDSGCSWPKDYIEKIDRWLWSGNRLGDLKLPWELNRHQYFVTLGKAYWLTGDEGYAEEFTQQITSWIRNNPERIGINWYSTLEISIRLISWALAFHFFRQSKNFIENAGNLFIKSLYKQTRFLCDHLTLDWEVRNNHILGEGTGLIFIASLFPEFKEADEWLRTGLHVFENELQLQTYSDGVNKEQATSYHRFVLDFLLLIVILSRRGAIPTLPNLESISEKMLNYVMHLSQPDGGVPMIGDADDGRGYVLDDGVDFWDFRACLAIGSVLYQRTDFKFVAKDFGEEAFWLLGPDGIKTFEQMECTTPEKTSVSFPYSGYYILRDAWTSDSDYALFRCGDFGLGGDGFSAHAHCDLLSFILGIRGVPVIVDSGTFTYNGYWRNSFRLTAAHNTLMVDGHEQAKPISEFSWKDVPEAKCLVWEKNRVVGAMQVAAGIMHRRELCHPKNGFWEVTDFIEG
ncbi:MAG: alginate lyase family protein, partial [Dehalococcoidia bacterium]